MLRHEPFKHVVTFGKIFMNVTKKITDFFVYFLHFLGFHIIFINFGVYPFRYRLNFSIVAAPYFEKFAVTKLKRAYILPKCEKIRTNGDEFLVCG